MIIVRTYDRTSAELMRSYRDICDGIKLHANFALVPSQMPHHFRTSPALVPVRMCASIEKKKSLFRVGCHIFKVLSFELNLHWQLGIPLKEEKKVQFNRVFITQRSN